MSDDDEVLPVTYASHLNMDEAFCACMFAAVELGLESAPIGVVTTPGTKNPKYVPIPGGDFRPLSPIAAARFCWMVPRLFRYQRSHLCHYWCRYPSTHTAQVRSVAQICFWHKADIPNALSNVHSWG